jgi:hypothetical protein
MSRQHYITEVHQISSMAILVLMVQVKIEPSNILMIV